MITDDSSDDLAGLLGTIKDMAPELWRSGERRCILPQKLEDLDDPEYLEDMRIKINKMKYLKDLLDAGSITIAEYEIKKAKLFIRT